MKKIAVQRIFDSFKHLENSILSAKQTLEDKEDVPPHLLERIANYEEMLCKQRTLADALCEYMTAGNWEEVTRHVRLINGLSEMIRDDAREVVAGSRVERELAPTEIMFS